MVNFSNIKGFTFDLDGIITNTAKFHEQAWHETAREVGTVWTDQLATDLKGISRMDSLEMILKAGNHENNYSQEEKIILADKKNKKYQNLIKQLTPTDILPGIHQLLDDLKDAGYLMSIASASKNAPTILDRLNIGDYFKGIVDPASLHAGKPSPEIFIRAGHILGFEPQEIIGLEDASAGVESIKGAGQTALGIGLATKKANPDLYFDNTDEVGLAEIKRRMI
ncbi:beta-phosphoglucomutase [Oenococcus sicerae]|uniref:Beta-phosphoglucomutase n=1 Tax=Oenococcus sicerae TaxID=2203724 RepID=A0AAJ1VP67_9LACO|nr:beta-phosphoglucomutase [Oenococcus sicerae]MDN6900949.1 beta-phosphoglucomutase [Oenococcus sicerae]